MRSALKIALITVTTPSIVLIASLARCGEIEDRVPAKLFLNYYNFRYYSHESGEKKGSVYAMDHHNVSSPQVLDNDNGEPAQGTNAGAGIKFLNTYPVEQGVSRPLVYDITGSAFRGRSSPDRFKFSPSDFMVPRNMEEIFLLGGAFLTNLAAHEFGHAVVADYVDASGSRVGFFEKDGGTFFLGTSSVEEIDSESVLPYTMGGAFFVDITFEHALRKYREAPGRFNSSLLFYSGADLLWYCMFAFYIGEEHPHYDPMTVSKETGISQDALFSIVLAKTMINAYRVYTGTDPVIPYFSVDRHSASLNFLIPF